MEPIGISASDSMLSTGSLLKGTLKGPSKEPVKDPLKDPLKEPVYRGQGSGPACGNGPCHSPGGCTLAYLTFG